MDVSQYSDSKLRPHIAGIHAQRLRYLAEALGFNATQVVQNLILAAFQDKEREDARRERARVSRDHR